MGNRSHPSLVSLFSLISRGRASRPSRWGALLGTQRNGESERVGCRMRLRAVALIYSRDRQFPVQPAPLRQSVAKERRVRCFFRSARESYASNAHHMRE